MLATNFTRSLIALLMVVILPMISFTVMHFVVRHYDNTLIESIENEYGDVPQHLREQVTWAYMCTSSSTPDVAEACNEYQLLNEIKHASLLAVISGALLIGIILFAGAIAKNSRILLLWFFKPLMYLTLLVLAVLTVVQAGLIIAAIYYGESALIGRVHIGIIFALGLGAIAGVFAMLRGLAGMVSNRAQLVSGAAVDRSEAPQLWKYVDELARRCGTKSPDNLLLGMDPTFFVTEAPLRTWTQKLDGRTMYISLGLMRLLSSNELNAVLAHEFGHFVGEDTKFSTRFYPVYAGLGHALAELEGGDSDGEGSAADIVLLPSQAVLNLFYSIFAGAENTIGRDREFKADKFAQEKVGGEYLATALVKVAAFAPAFDHLHPQIGKVLEEGRYVSNVGLFMATSIENVKEELLAGADYQHAKIIHPTDSHPPIAQRIERMEISVGAAVKSATQNRGDDSTESLLEGCENVEEQLSVLESMILAKSGRYDLPDEVRESLQV